MAWKCPPLNLVNWSNLWKWKTEMRDGGKGDAPRPLGVSMEQFDENFDAIFGKKEKKDEKDFKCCGKCDCIDGRCKSCPSAVHR